MAHDEGRLSTPIVDTRRIRALAHPLRLRILNVLAEHGPLTATEMSQQISESPQNCSFHLRTLARYGYIEDAGGGTGRKRPWKLNERTRFCAPVHANPGTIATPAAEATLGDTDCFEMSFDAWLTPDEVGQLNADISAAIRGVVERRTDEPESNQSQSGVRVLLHASISVGQEPRRTRAGSGSVSP